MGRKRKVGAEDWPDDETAQVEAAQAVVAQAAAAASALAISGLLPGLAANPLALAALGLAQQAAALPETAENKIDPDVQELCDHFHIEDRHIVRLNALMKHRQETFEGDLLKLWEKLEEARSPPGLLVVKMREMEEGTFIGKNGDKELGKMAKKFNLDDEAESKLADILGRYPEEKKSTYMMELEKHLEVSNRPSAMVMMLLKKLGKGDPLGRPGAPAPGSYLDRQTRERRDRDRDRRDDRERDRERRDDRRERRSRSRSRSRRR